MLRTAHFLRARIKPFENLNVPKKRFRFIIMAVDSSDLNGKKMGHKEIQNEIQNPLNSYVYAFLYACGIEQTQTERNENNDACKMSNSSDKNIAECNTEKRNTPHACDRTINR